MLFQPPYSQSQQIGGNNDDEKGDKETHHRVGSLISKEIPAIDHIADFKHIRHVQCHDA